MCLFCKIVKKEIPAKIINENNNFLAFEDISPKAPVHILIIPKKHYDSFDTFDSNKMSDMSDFIKDSAKKIKINNTGYRIISNIGDDGGQEVKHLHFHLFGGAKLKWTSLI
jgi:histidine triad (HIT) family protein